jgi:hypothetical protein
MAHGTVTARHRRNLLDQWYSARALLITVIRNPLNMKSQWNLLTPFYWLSLFWFFFLVLNKEKKIEEIEFSSILPEGKLNIQTILLYYFEILKLRYCERFAYYLIRETECVVYWVIRVDVRRHVHNFVLFIVLSLSLIKIDMRTFRVPLQK